jgi:iron(III) transport system permease protein
VVTLPLAVPASLVGVGLIALWNQPLLPLYGSPAMPVLAGLARFLPIATLIVLAQLRRLDPLLVDAATLLQAGRMQAWREVIVPLLAPGLIAAFGVTFVLTTGELGATLLVVPPGQATVTMRVYSFMHYGAAPSVAGLCLTTVAAASLAGAAAAWALEARRGSAP